jgi:hypothetical protein
MTGHIGGVDHQDTTQMPKRIKHKLGHSFGPQLTEVCSIGHFGLLSETATAPRFG